MIELGGFSGGKLKFKADFKDCTSLIGTKIELKLKNLLDNVPIDSPYTYTTVTINVESEPNVYLN